MTPLEPSPLVESGEQTMAFMAAADDGPARLPWGFPDEWPFQGLFDFTTGWSVPGTDGTWYAWDGWSLVKWTPLSGVSVVKFLQAGCRELPRPIPRGQQVEAVVRRDRAEVPALRE